MNKFITSYPIEQIKSENASTMNANKYFIIYKFCMETKNNKLIEISLYYIQVSRKIPLKANKFDELEIDFAWIHGL